MVRATQPRSNLIVQQLVERILNLGQISRQEHLQLTSTILSDYRITDEDRRQINRVFDYIQAGKLRVTD